jgi:hypothetical protein
MQLASVLLISPAFFLSLLRRLSKVSRVEIQPRLGRADNEVTRYRYNAILHVGHRAEPALEVAFEDWSERELKLDAIRSMLQQRSETFGIMRIQNPRVEKDLIAVERLRLADAALTVGELRLQIEQYDMRGIHPQDLFELNKEDLGFRIQLSWAACRPDGSYDALFVPKRRLQDQSYSAVQWPEPGPSDFVNLANSPAQGKFRAELIDRILVHCKQNLPEGLVLSGVTLVDMLPRTANGAVDPGALLRSREAGL